MHAYLKATAVILKEKSYGTPVTARWHCGHSLVLNARCRHRRVMQEPQLAILTGIRKNEESLVFQSNFQLQWLAESS